jgi:20S proteasome subunit alpha 5
MGRIVEYAIEAIMVCSNSARSSRILLGI